MTEPDGSTRPIRQRALVGPLVVAVGALHVTITPLVYGDSARSILDAGVLGAVDADPAQAPLRGLAFWYATAGIALLALGWAVTQIERNMAPLPRALPLVLAGIGAWGIALSPVSPFWVFFALAVAAELRRRSRTMTAATVAPPPTNSG